VWEVGEVVYTRPVALARNKHYEYQPPVLHVPLGALFVCQFQKRVPVVAVVHVDLMWKVPVPGMEAGYRRAPIQRGTPFLLDLGQAVQQRPHDLGAATSDRFCDSPVGSMVQTGLVESTPIVRF
jgi:hypothetical protein